MCGQEGYFGTSAFTCILDIAALSEIKAETQVLIDSEKIIEDAFIGLNKSTNPCSISSLTIPNNIQDITPSSMGEVTDEILLF